MSSPEDRANHPNRKMERMDYHTRTPEAAGDWARNNAPRQTHEDLQRLARSGRTMSLEEQRDYYDADYD
jgi:hypothetical protein